MTRAKLWTLPQRAFLPLLMAITLIGCASAGRHAAPREAMVAAADPRAVEAGLGALRDGGSAVDAAIAAMMVLGLVEPQSAGVGGGGFLLYYDRSERDVDAFDGRERAPAAAGPDLFLDETGAPLSFMDAIGSGRSIGTPALVPMLKLAHEKHGRLPWSRLFKPAISLAEEGFVVSPRMAQVLAMMSRRGLLQQDPAARAYFFQPDGSPVPAGALLRNPAYARTLSAIAARGPRALVNGPIAEEIVVVAGREPRGGSLSLEDLAGYAPRELEPICGRFRGRAVCGMPSPSSGGVAVLAILGLFERARPSPAGPGAVEDWHAFAWASRLAYADRDHYVADDAYVPVPAAALVDPTYLDARAKQIGPRAPAGSVPPGDPSTVLGGPSLLDRWGREESAPGPGTTHLTIVDGFGNVAALTATVEAPFGSQRMAAGFMLNNQLTDFSRTPTLNGKPVANAPAARKRPRSSMAPTLVFDPDGEFYAAIGSPGGSGIIAYVAKSIIGFTDWGLNVQDAIALPNVVASGPSLRVETGRMPAAITEALSARGWRVQPVDIESSGLHGVRVAGGGLEGGADPRREGVARSLPPGLERQPEAGALGR